VRHAPPHKRLQTASMPASLDGRLVVAISSRALFNFEEENLVFKEGDDQDYMALQFNRLDVAAASGVAFPLIRKLLAFNADGTPRVEVAILSRNDPVSGLRVFRSAQLAGLNIERGVFTRGRPPFRYLKPMNANLFLSAHEQDVVDALSSGFPAAHVYPNSFFEAERHPNEVRIAFDGDAVLFDDEAERIFQEKGLKAFVEHENEKARTPLSPGPFQPFLMALHRLQVASKELPMRIRTALVTARSAPAHERAVRTLMSWDIAVDEAMFLGGLDKGGFLNEFEPDFFFDDQAGHCDSAAKAGPTGRVPAGTVGR
jgi:5'-nucleotidase